MIGTKQGTKQVVQAQLLFVMNRLANACQRFTYSHARSSASRVDCLQRHLARSSSNDLLGNSALASGSYIERHGAPRKSLPRSSSTSPPDFAVRLLKFWTCPAAARRSAAWPALTQPRPWIHFSCRRLSLGTAGENAHQ
jgi:hypothetical protein